MTALRAGLVVAFASSLSLAAEPLQTAMIHATGTFDVTLTPQKDSPVGRQVIDKLYHGDLEATGNGEMLAAMGHVEGSGTYVAIEKVSGTLGGKKGEFALQHLGTMTRGKQSLTISVVPDSGTGDLKGLTGTMSIEIKDGKHFYKFDYSIQK